jgi:RNA-directed DNA polymerase
MIFDLELNGVSVAAQKPFKRKARSEEMNDTFLNRLEGYVNFIGQVRGKEDRVYSRYKKSFSRIAGPFDSL